MIDGIEFWHWLSLGGALVVVEMLAPGIFFLWPGIAALLVGIASWLWPDMHWQYQVLLFAGLSVAAVVLSRRFVRAHPIESDRPTLNRRGEEYVGRVFSLDAPIVNGIGRLKVGDTVWRAAGPDLAAGARVRVVSTDGATLRVEPA
ncbi:MAG: NfeD family protein [Alphaproteobacteria bacterium]